MTTPMERRRVGKGGQAHADEDVKTRRGSVHRPQRRLVVVVTGSVDSARFHPRD
jgi:hypothetical protein